MAGESTVCLGGTVATPGDPVEEVGAGLVWIAALNRVALARATRSTPSASTTSTTTAVLVPTVLLGLEAHVRKRVIEVVAFRHGTCNTRPLRLAHD